MEVNAHIVMEEAPAVARRPSKKQIQTLCLSARSASALSIAAANLAAYLESHEDVNLSDVAYTLAVGRRAMDYRLAFAADSMESAVKTLKSAKLEQTQKYAGRPRIAFQFSGQGSQFIGMGQELYASEPTYRTVVDECCELAEQWLGLDLRMLIFAAPSDATAAQLEATRLAQPALFITELALAKLWASWGIVPEAVVGHSLGEYTAATLAGVFTWEQALQLVCLRGQMMDAMPRGAMTSVPLNEAALTPYLRPGVSIAALNSPRASVFSGPFDAIGALESDLTRDGVVFRRLRTSHAFHSAMMQPMVEEFEAEVAKLPLQPPTMPFVSSVTGTWITPEQATSPRYWAEQVILPRAL